MYLLYSALYGSLLVLALPYFFFRSWREPGYVASLRERCRGARAGPRSAPAIWIHAVSVGEAIAASTLVPRLKSAYPGTRIVLSVTTPTGRRVAEERLPGVDEVFYCPFDLAFLVRRVMRRVEPRAVVVIETEIWPHLFREARRAGAVTLLVNGRISDRSFPRYRRVRYFLERYLGEIDRFLMQNELYARRIAELGAPRERIRVAGSLKFDGVPGDSSPAMPRVTPTGRKILVGGSTLDPEERILLSVFERVREEIPELYLVLAPRHVTRFDEVVQLARSRGLEVARRSQASPDPEKADVLVLDTLGELAARYAEADYVFVGGSLAPWGGHNIIEPASRGKPILFGPHMQNFADVARMFLDGGGAIQVADEEALERALRDLVARPETCEKLSRAALEVVDAHRGAADRTVAALKELLP